MVLTRWSGATPNTIQVMTTAATTIAIECVRQSSFLVQGRERFRSNEANEHTAEYGHKTKAATAKKSKIS